MFLPLWFSWFSSSRSVGTVRGTIPNQWLIFSGVIPVQGGSTGTARSSECCGKHQTRPPSSTAAARAHPHTLSHPKGKLELLFAPYQGIPTGLSRAGQCNPPLSGTHRSGCTWLSLPAFCWILQGEKNHKYLIYFKQTLPFLPSCCVFYHSYCWNLGKDGLERLAWIHCTHHPLKHFWKVV